MGWLRLKLAGSTEESPGQDLKTAESNAEHIEEVILPSNNYRRQPLSTSPRDLPYISANLITATKQDLKKLWIVVDNVVYDCTDFVHEHPGGNTVIESFRGEDCSWQFWRFHNAKHMRESGKPLRIGRTNGVANRFPEPPKFVGLRRPGQADEW